MVLDVKGTEELTAAQLTMSGALFLCLYLAVHGYKKSGTDTKFS